MKNVSLYLRCSTSNQSTDSQRAELEQYCQRHEWKVVNVYEDAAVSGSKADRPALKDMLRDAETGKAGDIIVVYKIDRLARSTADLLSILSQLTHARVGFCSTTQSIDTTSPMGRMVLTFLGAIAEFERETIVERVRTGLQHARNKGIKLGRPRVGFDVAEAIRLRDQGLGYKQIAKAMGIPRTTLYRTLQAIPKTPVAA